MRRGNHLIYSAADNSCILSPSTGPGGSGISPVLRDCVVELVGLEPTTKVLWNMVGVRPAPSVGHLSRSPDVLPDLPGFLILKPTTKVLWNMVGVRPTTLVGHPSGSSGVCCFP